MIDVILGLQWGDEGKGKIVDYFAQDYDLIARFQGGPNAGHTLYVDGKKVVLHTIPSGVFHPKTLNLIGNGVVLDPVTLKREYETVSSMGVDLARNLYLAEKTHLILPTHRALDKASELAKGNQKIGSTLKGIGPAYMDKTGRNGLRVGDLIRSGFRGAYESLRQKHLEILRNFDFSEDISSWEEEFFGSLDFMASLNITRGEYFINGLMNQGKRILAEGAQGSMLDIDFGTYPFVTSSNTISAGVCTGLGIAPSAVGEVIGVTKAYCTRVGGGPFPTELLDSTGEALRKQGQEFGSTTGRPRRCGWIDLLALKYSCMLSGVTQLVMTKADVLDEFSEVGVCLAYRHNGMETREMPFKMDDGLEPVWHRLPGWKSDISACRSFGSLPQAFRNFVRFIESELGIPFRFISNGPDRQQVIPLPGKI